MKMRIELQDGDRITASYKNHVVVSDQDGSAPAPFDYFLASIGTCTGFYVSRFCRQRGIPVDDIRIEQSIRVNRETHMVEEIEVEIALPQSFPEKYRKAVVRAAEQCAVTRHLESPPEVRVRTGDVLQPG